MKTPPLLLAAALLFWGRETGMFGLGLALAAAVEASRLIAGRLELTRDNQNRIADLCSAVFALAAAYTYATADSADAARLMLLRAPLFFAPLLAAQAYGASGGIDAGAFFWTLRRPGARLVLIDVSFPYAGVCLLAAAGANTRSEAFYPSLFALTGWGLWHQRPRWAPAPAAAALLAAAGLLGHFGHRALTALQPAVEQKALDIAYGLAVGRKDVFQSRTAIGSIGELKRSGRILLRLRSPEGRRPPALLRNAAYDVYKGRDWLAGSSFTELPGRSAEGTWELAPPAAKARTLAMDALIPGGEGPLALPAGTFRIEGLPAETLKRSRLGAVVVQGGPGAAELALSLGPGPSPASEPSPADLAVPPPLTATLARTARELHLKKDRPVEAMAAVSRFFEDGFRYSLRQTPGPVGADPLEDFLTRTKAGHCEHFATAATLLLRSAGIPARYATGFAVLEFSSLENAWVVRQRHAHAWTQAYVGGAWTDLDATPGSWSDAESADAPAWQPAADLGSWLRERLRRALRADSVRRGAMWGLAAVGLYLLWRLRGGLGELRARAERGGGPERPGADSELYRVEAELGRRGLGRRPEETVPAWARRAAGAEPRAARLGELARLHERHRFDPVGLGPEERQALRDGAAEILAELERR
ncbi:hypothetical protein EPO15_17320 [bacterium]|nr:MAG: hypothetical protein EPO15_17320 [bacterium]